MPTERRRGPLGHSPDTSEEEHSLLRQILPGAGTEEPQPIGRQLFAAGGGGKKQGSGKKQPSKSHKKKVLNLVTDFPNPWKTTTSEIEAIKKGAWAPSSDDFTAVAKSSHQVDHFYQLIGVIVKQPKGSIDRINIFTHSNPDLIAFKGTIVPHSTFAEVLLNTQSALSLQMLGSITDQTWFQVGKSKKKYFMKDVRTRFAKGAKVFFYSCKSGLDPQLLQEFANKFDVIAVGFKDNICFCPTFTAKTIDRKHVGLGKGCKGKSSDFSTLDSKGVERKPKP